MPIRLGLHPNARPTYTGGLNLEFPRREDEPSVLSSFGAAAQLENDPLNLLLALDLASAERQLVERQSLGTDSIEPYVIPYDQVANTPFEAYLPFLSQATSPEHFQLLQNRLKDEFALRERAAANPKAAFAGAMFGSVFSPVNLLGPGAALRGSGSALRGAFIGATMNLAGAGIQESALLATQETRTPLEAYMGIASSVFLGGILGAGAGALSKRAMRTNSRLTQLVVDAAPNTVYRDGPVYRKFTPEALVAFERRANERYMRGEIPTQEDAVGILRELGEEITDIEALRGTNLDDGVAIIDNGFFDLVERLVTPSRAGYSTIDEAAASGRNIQEMRRNARQGVVAHLLQEEAGKKPIRSYTGELSFEEQQLVRAFDVLGDDIEDGFDAQAVLREARGMKEEITELMGRKDLNIAQNARLEYLQRRLLGRMETLHREVRGTRAEGVRNRVNELRENRIREARVASLGAKVNVPRRILKLLNSPLGYAGAGRTRPDAPLRAQIGATRRGLNDLVRRLQDELEDLAIPILDAEEFSQWERSLPILHARARAETLKDEIGRLLLALESGEDAEFEAGPFIGAVQDRAQLDATRMSLDELTTRLDDYFAGPSARLKLAEGERTTASDIFDDAYYQGLSAELLNRSEQGVRVSEVTLENARDFVAQGPRALGPDDLTPRILRAEIGRLDRLLEESIDAGGTLRMAQMGDTELQLTWLGWLDQYLKNYDQDLKAAGVVPVDWAAIRARGEFAKALSFQKIFEWLYSPHLDWQGGAAEAAESFRAQMVAALDDAVFRGWIDTRMQAMFMQRVDALAQQRQQLGLLFGQANDLLSPQQLATRLEELAAEFRKIMDLDNQSLIPIDLEALEQGALLEVRATIDNAIEDLSEAFPAREFRAELERQMALREGRVEQVEADIGRVQSFSEQLAGQHERLIEAEGFASARAQELDDINYLSSLIDSTDNVRGIDALTMRIYKAYDGVIRSDAERLESEIEATVARIRTWDMEQKVAGPGVLGAAVNDTRKVDSLDGIGPALMAELNRNGIETVNELMAHLFEQGTRNLKGIDAKKEASFFEQWAKYVDLSAEKRAYWERQLATKKERLSKTGPPHLDHGLDETITVKSAPMSVEKLGYVLGGPQNQILQRSHSRTAKQLYMRLAEPDLIMVENETGDLISPDNIRSAIGIGQSMAIQALKAGPRQQWDNYVAGRDPSYRHGRTLGMKVTGLLSSDVRQRKSVMGKTEFMEWVGRVMHDPKQLELIDPAVRNYVQEAAKVMRESFYLPWAAQWEKAFPELQLGIDPMKYLLRSWDMRRVLGHEDKLASAAFTNLREKVVAFYDGQLARAKDETERAALMQARQRDIDEVKRLVPLWIEGITTTPGSREPMQWAEWVQRHTGGGRPSRRRVAFEFHGVEVDFEVIKPYLNTDIEHVTGKYVKTRIPDILLTTKLGDIRASQWFDAMKAEFNTRLAELERTKPADLEKQRQALINGYARDVKQLEGMIDILRGTNQLPLDPYSTPGRLARAGEAMRGINMMRVGGGFGITAIGDLGAAIQVHGFRRVFGQLTEEFVRRYRTGAKDLALEDIKALLIDMEDVLYSRVGSWADYDPYGHAPSLVEQGIQSGSRAMAQASLLMPWTNMMRHINAKISIRKLAEVSRAIRDDAPVSSFERAVYSRAGFTPEDARMIADMWESNGYGHNGGSMSLNVEAWGDGFEGLKSKIRRFVLEESNRATPAPGPGDKPLFLHGRVGQLQFQFKGFGLGYTNKLLLPGLQGLSHREYGVLASLGTGTVIGMMVYVLKQLASEREVPDDWELILQEGIVRADTWGKLTTLDEFSSTFTPFPSVLGLVGPKTFHGYDGRPWLERAGRTVLGPTFDTLNTARKAGMGLYHLAMGEGEAATEQQYRAMRQIAPFQNLFYLDFIFDALENGLEESRLSRDTTKRLPAYLRALQ